jgi:hypothetical protein
LAFRFRAGWKVFPKAFAVDACVELKKQFSEGFVNPEMTHGFPGSGPIWPVNVQIGCQGK